MRAVGKKFPDSLHNAITFPSFCNDEDNSQAKTPTIYSIHKVHFVSKIWSKRTEKAHLFNFIVCRIVYLHSSRAFHEVMTATSPQPIRQKSPLLFQRFSRCSYRCASTSLINIEPFKLVHWQTKLNNGPFDIFGGGGGRIISVQKMLFPWSNFWKKCFLFPHTFSLYLFGVQTMFLHFLPHLPPPRRQWAQIVIRKHCITV